MSDNPNYRFAGWDPLDNDKDTVSPQSVDEQTYGKPGALSVQRGLKSSRAIARPVDIYAVCPDLLQPRRTLPSLVQQYWDHDPTHLPELLNYWIDEVRYQSGIAYDVTAMLQSAGDRIDVPEDREPLPLEAALLRLIELAASIQRDGLLNPITVTAQGDYFLIETGERRWLAYHLLYARLQDPRWARVPAIEVQRNVWRQAAENNARDNLNAIGRARQYAILMMDLYADRTFVTYQESTSDRAYYAQVLGLRVPTGTSERLLSAMGVTDRSRLSRYRSLLELSDEEWVWADDQNISERELLRARNNGGSEGENTPKPAQKPREKAERVERTFVERAEKTFADFGAKIDRMERKISKDTKTDYSVFEPLIDEQIRRLQQLKKRVRR